MKNKYKEWLYNRVAYHLSTHFKFTSLDQVDPEIKTGVTSNVLGLVSMLKELPQFQNDSNIPDPEQFVKEFNNITGWEVVLNESGEMVYPWKN